MVEDGDRRQSYIRMVYINQKVAFYIIIFSETNWISKTRTGLGLVVPQGLGKWAILHSVHAEGVLFLNGKSFKFKTLQKLHHHLPAKGNTALPADKGPIIRLQLYLLPLLSVPLKLQPLESDPWT